MKSDGRNCRYLKQIKQIAQISFCIQITIKFQKQFQNMNFASMNCNQAMLNYMPQQQIWPAQDYSSNSKLFCLISHALSTSVSEFQKKKQNKVVSFKLVRSEHSVVVIESDHEEEQIGKSFNFQIRQKETIEDKNSITQTRENLCDSQPDQHVESKNLNEISLQSLNEEFLKQKSIETPIVYEIECPKIGITLREMQSKKQQLLARRVLDWSKPIKKANDNLEQYRAREMRMLFK